MRGAGRVLGSGGPARPEACGEQRPWCRGRAGSREVCGAGPEVRAWGPQRSPRVVTSLRLCAKAGPVGALGVLVLGLGSPEGCGTWRQAAGPCGTGWAMGQGTHLHGAGCRAPAGVGTERPLPRRGAQPLPEPELWDKGGRDAAPAPRSAAAPAEGKGREGTRRSTGAAAGRARRRRHGTGRLRRRPRHGPAPARRRQGASSCLLLRTPRQGR